jgi:hypothetical protein
MQDRQKLYRREATTDRQLAVQLFHECRRANMSPKAERAGHQFIVVAKSNEWDLWRALNRARATVKARRAAAAIEDAKAIEARTKPEYFDDTWAQDEALTDDYGRYFDSDNLPYIHAIYDVARSSGYDAQWRRVEASGARYRVTVWEVSASVFSEILQAASETVAQAVAA